ncbi:hypothetical protein [Nonomuraea guangzhouensis]|uniref:Uncharacterized protein n=1 Tax=Nonomuraea guangzhouensis TaxID=1291555 RepID=A0ABW4GK13_9ACTN|nr:hypothetical protein [Nonomuraea guangzhouensis]
MTSDELKVPSQRADHPNDHPSDHPNDRANDPPNDEDERASGSGYGPADDFRTDDPSQEDERDDFRANDTPTVDLTGEGEKDRHHEPYAPADGDMLAYPPPSPGSDPAHAEHAEPDEYSDEQDDVHELVAVEGAPPAHAAPPESVVLFDQDPAEVQARWRELQTSFVDDPGDAVQRAEGLVDEVVEALTSSLTARTGELRDRWKGAGDTEQLRLALREYRVVLERLLTLSAHETR